MYIQLYRETKEDIIIVRNLKFESIISVLIRIDQHAGYIRI